MAYGQPFRRYYNFYFHVLGHCGFWKVDVDLALVFHSKYRSILHRLSTVMTVTDRWCQHSVITDSWHENKDGKNWRTLLNPAQLIWFIHRNQVKLKQTSKAWTTKIAESNSKTDFSLEQTKANFHQLFLYSQTRNINSRFNFVVFDYTVGFLSKESGHMTVMITRLYSVATRTSWPKYHSFNYKLQGLYNIYQQIFSLDVVLHFVNLNQQRESKWYWLKLSSNIAAPSQIRTVTQLNINGAKHCNQ